MAILFVVFLACLVSSAECKCKHSSCSSKSDKKIFRHDVTCVVVCEARLQAQYDDMERPTGDGHRRQWDSGDKDMSESSKITLRLCFKDGCGSLWRICYCCMTLPNIPCYKEQQKCWDVCPSQTLLQQPQHTLHRRQR